MPTFGYIYHLKNKIMTSNVIWSKRPSLAFIAITVVLFSIASCARKMSFQSSPVVPAAKGHVKIKSDKNHNSTIDMSFSNLAPVDKLTPPRHVYVVWMVTENNGSKNIGKLNSSSSMLSSALKASLKTSTAFKPVSFFVTAEDDGAIQYPGSQIIMSTAK
jgi:hypothetical protein